MSYFNSPIQNITPLRDVTLREVADIISNDLKLKSATEEMRALADSDKRNIFKCTKFPYVTPSGIFSTRKATELKDYSGFIVLDFDDLDDVDDAKSKILNQTEVDIALLYISPSGNGLKCIVPSTIVDEHSQVYKMYQQHFEYELGLKVDSSGKDIARASFLAHDPKVFHNGDAKFRKLEEYWEKPTSEKNVSHNNQQPSVSNARSLDPSSPFEDYNSRGDSLALLEAYGWLKESEDNEKVRLIRPGKKSGVSADFRLSDKLLFVFTDATDFEADKAYNPSQIFSELECGGDMKVARKKLLAMEYGKQSSSRTSEGNELEVDNESGNLDIHSPDYKELNPINLIELYNREGLIRTSEPGSTKVSIFKNDNKVLRPFNHEANTISLLLRYNNYPKEDLAYHKFLLKKERDILNSFKFMPAETPEWNKDTKYAMYNSFKNGVAKVTKDGVEMLDYNSDELGFFPELDCQKYQL
ncbi:MAG: BT4734/BF3469 family protein [Candidatus Saccharimonadaceae bacterium]